MEINIYRTNQDGLNKQNKAIWKSSSKKSLRAIAIYFALGIILLSLEFFRNNKLEPFWGFNTSFGLAFVLLAILFLYFHLSARNRFFQNARLIVSQWSKFNTGSHIKLTDDGYTYKDSQVYQEVKWSVFTSCIVDKQHIIFIQIEPQIRDFVIYKSELKANELAELLEFIRPLHRYN